MNGDTVNVAADSLKDACMDAARTAATGRSYLPVLTHILVKAHDGQLTIAGSDMETTLMVGIPDNNIADWALAVPGATFRDYVKTLKGDVSLEPTGNRRLEVRSSTSRATFAGVPEEDFPTLPQADPAAHDFGEDLVEALAFVQHAISTDENHLVLSGAHIWTMSDQRLRIEAADGFRLATYTMGSFGQDVDAILPRDAVDVLARACPGEVGATFGNAKVTFRYLDRTLDTTLLAGSFPDIEQILAPARGAGVAFALPRDEMIDAVKRAMILARDTNNVIVLEGDGHSVLVLSSKTSHGDTMRSEVQVENAPQFRLACNGRFLQDALGAFVSSDLQMRVKGATEPFHLSDKAGTEGECVLMPMQLGD